MSCADAGPDGGFYSTQDADSGARRASSSSDSAEIPAVLGDEADDFMRASVTPGNFEGRISWSW